MADELLRAFSNEACRHDQDIEPSELTMECSEPSPRREVGADNRTRKRPFDGAACCFRTVSGKQQATP
jgi:hypothetical protein